MSAPRQSAFGSELGTPAQAAAVLRARASAAGLELLPASGVDLVAAVVVAHCWALATGRSALSGTLSLDEAADLSCAIARAAGHGEAPAEALADDSAVVGISTSTLAAVAPVVEWACGTAGPAALEVAAFDLARASSAQLAGLAVLVGGWETPASA